MDNNFIKGIFYNSNIITIIFNESMCTSGVNSILNPLNYSISNGADSICLKDLIKSSYCYDNYFVSFNIKDNFNQIFKIYKELKCGYVALKNLIFIKNSLGSIQDICISTTMLERNSNLSFINCNGTTLNEYSLLLKNYDIIPYCKIDLNDFYVVNNNKEYFPIKMIKKTPYELLFIFNENIFLTPLDKISLHTRPVCKSTDSLGNIIKENDSLLIDNLLKTKINTVSISSYINNTLLLTLDFTSKVIRYSSKDFDIYINDVWYPSKGYSPFTKTPVTLTIDNLYNFNFAKDTILVKSSNSPYPYTIDSRQIPVYDLVGKNSNYFISLKGTLYSNSYLNLANLEILFNNNLNSSTTSQKGILNISSDKSLITFEVLNVGTLRIFGNSLLIDPLTTDYTLTSSVDLNKLKILIYFTTFNFIESNKNNIEYIDFIPLSSLKDSSNHFPLTSFEAPIKFYFNNGIVCYPNDYGPSWSLLGKTTTSKVTLIVDKSISSRNYGIQNQTTTFLEDLHIINNPTPLLVSTVNIYLTNISGKVLYINLPDEYNLILDNCKFDDIEIL